MGITHKFNVTMGDDFINEIKDSQPLIKNQPTAAREKHVVLPGKSQYFQEVSSCPPGLEYLTKTDHLLVKQTVKTCEVLMGGCCYVFAHEYTVKNSMDNDVYRVEEKSDACERQLCGSSRGFDLEITDNTGRKVLNLS